MLRSCSARLGFAEAVIENLLPPMAQSLGLFPDQTSELEPERQAAILAALCSVATGWAFLRRFGQNQPRADRHRRTAQSSALQSPRLLKIRSRPHPAQRSLCHQGPLGHQLDRQGHPVALGRASRAYSGAFFVGNRPSHDRWLVLRHPWLSCRQRFRERQLPRDSVAGPQSNHRYTGGKE